MHRQANYRKSPMGKGLNIAKRRTLAVRLLKAGKRSLRDIAQITDVDKSTLSVIGNRNRSNDDVILGKMLCRSPCTTREVQRLY